MDRRSTPHLELIPEGLRDTGTLVSCKNAESTREKAQENRNIMAYADGNPKTKKALKEAVAAGKKIYIFSPGPFPPKQNGVETIEGPQFPEPHRWYAQVTVKDGVIVSVK